MCLPSRPRLHAFSLRTSQYCQRDFLFPSLLTPAFRSCVKTERPSSYQDEKVKAKDPPWGKGGNNVLVGREGV